MLGRGTHRGRSGRTRRLAAGNALQDQPEIRTGRSKRSGGQVVRQVSDRLTAACRCGTRSVVAGGHRNAASAPPAIADHGSGRRLGDGRSCCRIRLGGIARAVQPPEAPCVICSPVLLPLGVGPSWPPLGRAYAASARCARRHLRDRSDPALGFPDASPALLDALNVIALIVWARFALDDVAAVGCCRLRRPGSPGQHRSDLLMVLVPMLRVLRVFLVLRHNLA